MKRRDWHTVTYTRESVGMVEETERLRVPGGWLYRSSLCLGSRYVVTMTFVPLPKRKKEEGAA